ncbi:MAG: polysaccharide deacetylase family protein [Solirubrobacteraceae bacterium]|nr:polysaccharide deacetylase family protein [Solirubrobacteraceae bacterium]
MPDLTVPEEQGAAPAAPCSTTSIALTFDDGPDPLGTPQVLDALREVGARATFFVITARAEAEPWLIAQIQDDGHAIEVHCRAHVRHTELSEAQIEDDLASATESLAGFGVTPRLWRTPWGVRTEATERVAAAAGLQLVHWDADTHDWRGDSAAQMTDAVLAELDGEGGIVLAHDGLGPGAQRDDCEQTAAFVRMFGGQARAQGWRLTGLDHEGRAA